ncbi:hypothetical protein C6P40_000350 [Pichia californica]|uniref:Bromo domain-containing protein n=1 Tax=Pichia californica TaxID=460514 RepID=A0A9P6WKQ2_9ASCO|nr:hypothetical protein C6P40_000350 [[Candida] californica]
MPPKRKVTLTLGSSKKKQRTSDTLSPTAAGGAGAGAGTEKTQVEHDLQQEEAVDSADDNIIPDYYSSLIDFYTHVINTATNLKDPETNEVISGPFLKLPPKKLYADYYQLIENPISLNEIRQATIVKHRNKDIINSLSVNTLQDFKNLWIQMSKNASTYNDPDSLIVNDANSITNYAVKEIENYSKYLENLTEKESKKSKLNKSRSKSKSNNLDDNINNSINETEYSLKKDLTPEPKENIQLTKEESEIQKAIDDYDDSNDDYSSEILKVLRHLLTFKVSHHKNSIPLSRVLLDLPNKDEPDTKEFYNIVTEPMCFNMISEKLDDGKYSGGTLGYKNFINDVNLIFDNILDVFEDGPYFKAATGLSKAFTKRLEKFENLIKDKKRQAVTQTKGSSEKEKSRKKSRSVPVKKQIIDNDDEFNDGIDDDDDDDNNNNNNNDNDKNNDEENDLKNNNIEGEENFDEGTDIENKPTIDIPTFVRKHDIEKAKTIEEIDDITAFIKRFTICSITNLNNLANNWKSLINSNIPVVTTSKNNSNNSSNQPISVFENIIVEPAGNTTLGGSTYSLQLPGSAIIGHEIACIIHLQNKIVDDKYISELRVNGETINGIPMSILYDESAGDDGIFCAGKYSLRLGYGLNYFEFTLKVPFPLTGKQKDENLEKYEKEDQETIEQRIVEEVKEKEENSNSDYLKEQSKEKAEVQQEKKENVGKEDDEEENAEKHKDSEPIQEQNQKQGDDKREHLERGSKPQEFVENIKIWLNITR